MNNTNRSNVKSQSTMRCRTAQTEPEKQNKNEKEKETTNPPTPRRFTLIIMQANVSLDRENPMCSVRPGIVYGDAGVYGHTTAAMHGNEYALGKITFNLTLMGSTPRLDAPSQSLSHPA